MMNKRDWELAYERVEAIRVNAVGNRDKAEKDIEEIDFMLSHYKEKIEAFPKE
jgi:hypothetical protein